MRLLYPVPPLAMQRLQQLCIFSLILLLPAVSIAQQTQSCCNRAKQNGQAAFNRKDYGEAIRIWTAGKKCTDAAKCPDLDALIKKARNEQQKQTDAAAEQARQREAERQRQEELARQREAAAAAERQRQAAEQERLRREAEAKAADDAYEIAKAANNKAAYQAFLRSYPNSRHAADSRSRIEGIDWLDAQRQNNKAAYEAFIQAHPNSSNIAEAQKRIADFDALPVEDKYGLRFVKGGAFQMGSTDGDDDEKPVRTVTVSDFYLGKYEVTNEEYCAFLNEKGNQTEGGVEWIDLSGSYDDEKCRIIKDGSRFRVQSGYEKYPVIFVSWFGATAYCKWLSEKSGFSYRLPTEAEWEYAAGNGSKHTKYSWGNGAPSGKKGGNVADETAKKRYPSWTIFDGYTDGYVYTAPVGSFDPNEFGLYDMSGNVWEWCSDWYDSAYYGKSGNTNNPTGPSTGSRRVCRGGSWRDYPQRVRVAFRSIYTPGFRNYDIGFRLARAVR